MSIVPSTAPQRSSWQKIKGKALDFLLPPLCIACDSPVGANGALCTKCWGKIHFITPSYCACCGTPFDVPVGDDMQCGSCLNEAPYFKTARAPMLYDDASKRLILGFKHGDRTHSVKGLASWMQRAGQDALSVTDYIIPVPLHRWRLFKRRYNQAALLSHALGQSAGKKVLIDALQRTRATPIQGHMRRKERQKNVQGAFAITPRFIDYFKDKTIILIDDVLTTGATVNECSRILLQAGATQVHVLTLARVRSYA